MSIPILFCAFITAVSALVSLGFSIAAAFNTANDVRRIALYTCARSVALVLGSAVPFFTGSAPWLQAGACSIVQGCDAAIGAANKERMETSGPPDPRPWILQQWVAEPALGIYRARSIA